MIEGVEPGSNYQNALYLFKRIASMLKDEKVAKVTLDLVVRTAQKIVNNKQFIQK